MNTRTMAKLLLRSGKQVEITESTAQINNQKSNDDDYFVIHMITKTEPIKIKRSDILTIRDE